MRLIGASPGYIGYEEGGTLTESIRRCPYQILLLDEFEKGHRDVWNILLQLFDDGHLTDSHGRKVNFMNVLVVMTSNLGANVFAQLPSNFTGSEPIVRESVMEVIHGTLSPELLNRIDETVIFSRLQRENMDDIARIQLEDISKRLIEGNNMTLDISDLDLACIAEKGYNVRYGARPLKRVLNSSVLNPLSRLVLEGSVLEGETVLVRTLGEVESKSDRRLWLCSNNAEGDQNEIVIL